MAKDRDDELNEDLPGGDEFSLESILAEFGGGQKKKKPDEEDTIPFPVVPKSQRPFSPSKKPVRVLTAAVPAADFENVFTSAGINQTLHQVMLHIRVECTLLIPGGTVDTAVETRVCAAETLLVGQVPDAYLELPGSP